MDLSHPIRSVIPSLEGDVLVVMAGTSKPLTGTRIAQLASSRGRRPSRQGVRLALARLVDQGVILSEPSTPSTLYRINEDHLMWLAVDAVTKAAAEAYGELVRRTSALVESLSDQHQPRSVAFYGSVARGESGPQSDVDVVVFDLARDDDLELTSRLTVGIKRWTGNPCHVYSVSSRQLSELVQRDDPIVSSWRHDARTVFGSDFRSELQKVAKR